MNGLTPNSKQAFPDVEDITRGAVTYSPSEAAKPALPCEAATYWLCQKDENRSVETQKVLELVQSLRQEYPNERTAILVRTRSHLRHIIKSLRQAGLQWLSDRHRPFRVQASYH